MRQAGQIEEFFKLKSEFSKLLSVEAKQLQIVHGTQKKINAINKAIMSICRHDWQHDYDAHYCVCYEKVR